MKKWSIFPTSWSSDLLAKYVHDSWARFYQLSSVCSLAVPRFLSGYNQLIPQWNTDRELTEHSNRLPYRPIDKVVSWKWGRLWPFQPNRSKLHWLVALWYRDSFRIAIIGSINERLTRKVPNIPTHFRIDRLTKDSHGSWSILPLSDQNGGNAIATMLSHVRILFRVRPSYQSIKIGKVNRKTFQQLAVVVDR